MAAAKKLRSGGSAAVGEYDVHEGKSVTQHIGGSSGAAEDNAVFAFGEGNFDGNGAAFVYHGRNGERAAGTGDRLMRNGKTETAACHRFAEMVEREERLAYLGNYFGRNAETLVGYGQRGGAAVGIKRDVDIIAFAAESAAV